MKKVFYLMLSLVMLQSAIYSNGNGFQYQVLRYHNKPIDQGTNTTDPVDHGRYVPSLYNNYYFNNNQFPMFIAFTLIVNNGTYGHFFIT